MSQAELTHIEKKLQELSPQLHQGFQAAAQALKPRLEESALIAWAQDGLTIAGPTSRSWEAGVEYFLSSPTVAQTLTGSEFAAWAQWGKLLARESPTLACSFFKASTKVVSHLSPRDIGAWAQLGKSLYQGNWRSGTLACAFFDASDALVPHTELLVLDHFVQFLDKLAQKSPDLALSIVGAAGEVFHEVERPDQLHFLAVASALAETSPTDVKPYLRAGSKIIAKVAPQQRARFLTLAQRLALQSGSDTLPFIIDGSWALGEIAPDLHPLLLSLAEKLMALAPGLAIAFLKNSPTLISRLKLEDLDTWYQDGVRLYQTTPEAGLAFFKLESAHSEALLGHLSCRVELGQIVDTLQMYVTALTGKEVGVAPTDSLVKRKVGWAAQDRPTTEGMSIFLPGFVERYETKKENFTWYKVASTHQSAHIEFASFEFDFLREALVFSNLRPELAKRAKKDGHVTDLERFFDLFSERKLAKDVFTAVEDARIDARVCHEYRGLRPAYQGIQRDSVQERPPFFRLTLREAFLEILTRIGLGSEERFNVPPKVRPHLKWCQELLSQVQLPQATVEDAAEATIRLYAILLQVPNEVAPQEDWQTPPQPGESEAPPVQDFDDPHWFDLLQEGEGGQEEEPEPDQERQDVDYRGDFKPELVQLMMKMKLAEGQQGQKPGVPMTEEELRQLLEKTAELDITMDLSGDMSQISQLFAHNLFEQMGMEKVTTPDDKALPKAQGPDRTAGEPLQEEPQTFLYDEWDFRAGDYKPRWCRVRQKPMEEGAPDFYKRTLETYSGLVSQIKRQFELLAPEGVRKVRRLPDGEDYDMDAVIEAVVDAKAGSTPSEKLYWQRKKVERDVAIAFLLDMSASTAEIITESKKGTSDPIPDNPRQYLAWLQGQRTGDERRYQRIIDVEKESIVLLIKALETMGDDYGIYGFSSYGRENVEFYTIKDLGESFSDRVKRRIDKVSPMHATRMGPAIRHATSKLAAQDAKTKILFLVSDGRPQDQGYSRDGVEKEYAIHDTKMALNEAKRKQIVPFCLTVDKAGHGYLKTMCEDIGYEVVTEIESLPTRILNLYRRLAF